MHVKNFKDKQLKILLSCSVVFLIIAVTFCIIAAELSSERKTEAEKMRLENETKLAELQMGNIVTASKTEKDTDADKNYDVTQSAEYNILYPNGTSSGASSVTEQSETTSTSVSKKIIVLDAGHGKSSSQMSQQEKENEGYVYNDSKGNWGEWRHYKTGTFGEDCNGSGCTGLSPENGSCWYSMGSGDRDTEPEINLKNAEAAKKYLEEMGYEVRMTRTTNDQNPSMNKRVSYCFKNNDTTTSPDAAAYICIHSNAGGGSGTSYISLSAKYTQRFIGGDYISSSNEMGKTINDKVAEYSGLKNASPINTPYLILFNKCPVPIAYMEIGFYDNSSDLETINEKSDEIGKAIAEGVDEYLSNK